MPSLRLGNIAPDFEAETTAGPIRFHNWIGESWVREKPQDGYLAGVDLIIGHFVLAPWRLHPSVHDRAR